MRCLDDTIKVYVDAWNEQVAAKRIAMLEDIWADNGRYTDALSDVTGREELSAHIGQFHKDYENSRINLTSAVQTHHFTFHFTWNMTDMNGELRLNGRDFGLFDQDGRITLIVGFFIPPEST